MDMALQANDITLWQSNFPRPGIEANKYDRGHAVIFGAPTLTGATRLAAGACSGIGAGLVTVVAATRADVLRTSLSADIMVHEGILSDLNRVNVLLGGPGGLSPEHRSILLGNSAGAKRVFDADAIPEQPDWDSLDADAVLTPHMGEFERKFPNIDGSAKARAIEAARVSGAILLLKGPTSYIAHPDGRIAVNDRPNPYLAKAGTGDVLAGILAGLLAQGMPAFEAACASVWIHSEAGQNLGPGLTACDLETQFPLLLRQILKTKN